MPNITNWASDREWQIDIVSSRDNNSNNNKLCIHIKVLPITLVYLILTTTLVLPFCRREQRPKWSSIPLWLLTRARTIKGISMQLHRKIMSSSSLSKELRQKYNGQSMPIKKENEVQVGQEHCKGQQIGKAVQVYRKKYTIYTKWVKWEKANSTTVHVAIRPSKVVITGPKVNESYKDPWI